MLRTQPFTCFSPTSSSYILSTSSFATFPNPHTELQEECWYRVCLYHFMKLHSFSRCLLSACRMPRALLSNETQKTAINCSCYKGGSSLRKRHQVNKIAESLRTECDIHSMDRLIFSLTSHMATYQWNQWCQNSPALVDFVMSFQNPGLSRASKCDIILK